ncbi:MAG: hypothetical protein WBE76_15145 [Terracidiphilus sp.]
MEPTTSKSGTAGASQTEGQSLSPNTKTNTAATKTDTRNATQDNAATGTTGNKANQLAGYGKTTNR